MYNNSTVKDYLLLMKPRVMSLVVFTAFIGLLRAPGEIHPVIGFAAILCITLGSGAAAVINMWYDRDIDAVMQRTQKRPIITKAIEADEALSFGIILGFFSVFLMALCVNFFSAFLLLFTILYYVFVYTIWLKRTSIQNVVIGGVAGALPPMIGYTTVSSAFSYEPLILFTIIFMWTPPHSWALALLRCEDYNNCNIPMMPVIKGVNYTKNQILLYTILMLAAVAMPYFLKVVSILYLIISTILGIIFLYYAVALFKDKNNFIAKKFFIYSIFYLFLIFLALFIEYFIPS